MGKTIQLFGFPHLVPAKNVIQLLERITGQGSIVAIEVKDSMRGSRKYAKVQFTDDQFAKRIMELANRKILRYDYGTTYLMAFISDNDMIQSPRSSVHKMEQVTVNFGCMISRERFSVLWKAESVSVEFGTGMKKMHLFLSHNLVEYKLQLSYENIWDIVMYNPRGQTGKILVLKLFGGVRIYKKMQSSPYSYYSETQDDQWIRNTDFTPSLIGQSSGLCLHLPQGMRLPNLKEYFYYYKESQDRFHLDMGLPFSDENSYLVPIKNPPQRLGLELPYKIIFKVCSLVQTGCLPGPVLDETFFQMVEPKRFDIRYINHALEKMYYLKECCYNPVAWLNEQYHKYKTKREQPSSPSILLDEGLVYVHRVQVTPTRVYFLGPEVNMSNCVLRQYKEHIDHFLRVSFVDEEWEKMYGTDLSPRVAVGEEMRTFLYERVLTILKEGIRIGDKKFDFLAFSSSQLRDNSLWMFAPVRHLNAEGIRQWMGDFHSIRNVAKYATRLGQSFGSSTETLTILKHEIEKVEDVMDVGGKYVFSDGIGKISQEFAQSVAAKCGFIGSWPSAFQIRYGGYKGVVAVDPLLSKKLSLRPSMLKYQSENNKLDVLSWSKYQPCFLNRQIITLLSTLGVQDHVFEKKQRESVAQLDGILVDPLMARATLDLMHPEENTNILKEMLKCGYKPDGEPFLSMMLQAFRSSKLLDLKLKARVFLPQARQMMGCLDEKGILRYGEVFVQCSGAGRERFNGDSLMSSESSFIVTGKVVVAKNPCLHPGDVRLLLAVDIPELYHMVDCIIFPKTGERPHPNECSGSDLDGDIYFVCWDPDLIPPNQVQPMDYSPAPSAGLDHDVKIEEVEEYFTNYIMNDNLGIIANAHTVFADKEPLMALSGPCMELARLFSIAVDFPKTGIPAIIPHVLRVKEYPDFMNKPEKTTYLSTRINGKLFREVKDISHDTTSIQSFTKDVARRFYDSDLEVERYEEYVDEAFKYKTEYDYKLGNMMEYYGIRTEAEILSGGIMKMSKTFDRSNDVDSIAAAVRSLRSEARSWFKRGDSDDLDAKASAWYHVSYHPDYWGSYNEGFKRRDHYISFPWCVYDRLVKIKKDKVRRRDSDRLVRIKKDKVRRRDSEVEVLGRDFGRRRIL